MIKLPFKRKFFFEYLYYEKTKEQRVGSIECGRF